MHIQKIYMHQAYLVALVTTTTALPITTVHVKTAKTTYRYQADFVVSNEKTKVGQKTV